MITKEAQAKGTAAIREKADRRAKVILAWVDGGMRTSVIAKRLGINEKSVRTVVLRSRRRLNRPYRPESSPGGYVMDEPYLPRQVTLTASKWPMLARLSSVDSQADEETDR